jgi:hypothetical protein
MLIQIIVSEAMVFQVSVLNKLTVVKVIIISRICLKVKVKKIDSNQV